MRLSLVCLFILTASFFVVPERALAQATAARPTSEQSLQELVREVRQLRSTLQRMNAAMYKGQVMLERLKLQQAQVARFTRELSDVRENLSELRGQQTRMNELLTRAEAGVEVGMKNPADLAGLKAELQMLKEREQRFAARETQLANDLELERAKLNELNDRLNALELELGPARP
jgi:DNA repair exonuclease SbcCD ATPase subunit